MAIDFNSLDYDDPCAMLAALRPAYYKLIAGAAVAEVRHIDGRMVQVVKGDAAQLEALIDRFKIDCDAVNGKTVSRRRAIKSGFRAR